MTGRLRDPLLIGALGVIILATGGCENLTQYSGVWTGSVSRDPAHQHGFGPQAELTIDIGNATRAGLEARIELPGHTGFVRFRAIRHAADDALAEVQLSGDSLRTYFGFLEPPGEAPYLAIISLFTGFRVETRLIRGADDAYGVFALERGQAPDATRPP